MLKKAGILVAATAAGLLAVSPLAFAGDKGDDWDHDGDRQVNRVDNDRDSSQLGLVNVGDVNALNDVNVCPAIPVAASLGNVLGILGTGPATSAAGVDEVSCVNDDSTNQLNNR